MRHNLPDLIPHATADGVFGIDSRADIEGLIGKALAATVRQFRSGWYTVELSPLVVSMPGRPDLEGGPVTRETRKAILDLIREEGVVWQGNVVIWLFLSRSSIYRRCPRLTVDSRTRLGTFGSTA